jgi:hypothetical protein
MECAAKRESGRLIQYKHLNVLYYIKRRRRGIVVASALEQTKDCSTILCPPRRVSLEQYNEQEQSELRELDRSK